MVQTAAHTRRGSKTNQAHASVFVSYRHENDEYRARVRDLSERLERAGINVVLDQFAQERDFHGGGPNEGWPRWSKRQAGNPAHKVLIIASDSWFQRYASPEPPRKGLGAAAEAAVIQQRLYNHGGVNPDVRIVSFSDVDLLNIPLDLEGYQHFNDPTDFSQLVCWLTNKKLSLQQPSTLLEWPRSASAPRWSVANHVAAREAFELLLSRDSTTRYLALHSPRGSGKSHIVQQIFSNALRVQGLACGRLDFKGSVDLDAPLGEFLQHLDVPEEESRSPVTMIERLRKVLHHLKKRARPTLVIFDSYEAAGDTKLWVKNQLLPTLVRAPWLRVVIAGQHIPASAGSLWEREACDPICLASPPAKEWYEFGRAHKPGITLEFVTLAHQLCQGNARTLSTLLGPLVQPHMEHDL